MFNYQIIVEYIGSNFVGWQIQKNGLSVQEVLEKAVSKFLKDKIRPWNNHFAISKNCTNSYFFR